MIRPPPRSTLFPYTPLSRPHGAHRGSPAGARHSRAGVYAHAPRHAQGREDSRRHCGGDVQRTPRPHQGRRGNRSEEHTSELQSRLHLVCRLLLEKKKTHASVDVFATLFASTRIFPMKTMLWQIIFFSLAFPRPSRVR